MSEKEKRCVPTREPLCSTMESARPAGVGCLSDVDGLSDNMINVSLRLLRIM